MKTLTLLLVCVILSLNFPEVLGKPILSNVKKTGTYTNQGTNNVNPKISEKLSGLRMMPKVYAGDDQHIALPVKNYTTLIGTYQSGFPAGNISFLWEQVRGNEVTIDDVTAQNTVVHFNSLGDYTFRLTMTYNGMTSFDTVHVNVSLTEFRGKLTIDNQCYFKEVKVVGNYLYVLDQHYGFRIFDLTNPEQPQQISMFSISGLEHFQQEGDYVYLSHSNSGNLTILNVKDKFHPKSESVFHIRGDKTPADFIINSGMIYVASSSGEVLILDGSNPSNPIQVGNYVIDAKSLVLFEDKLFVVTSKAEGAKTISLLTISDPVNIKETKNSFSDQLLGPNALQGNRWYLCETNSKGETIFRCYLLGSSSVGLDLPPLKGITHNNQSIVSKGYYTYLNDGLIIIRTTDLLRPVEVSRENETLLSVGVKNNYLYGPDKTGKSLMIYKSYLENTSPFVYTKYNLDVYSDTVNLKGIVEDDGFPLGSSVSQSWKYTGINQSDVTFSNPNNPSTQLLLKGLGRYEFQLSATDGEQQDIDVVVCNRYPKTSSDLKISQLTTSSLKLTWKRGEGDNAVVVARKGKPIPRDPKPILSPIKYSSSFGSGETYDTLNYFVYYGKASEVTVTNLQKDSTYYFNVYEYSDQQGDYIRPPLKGQATVSQTASFPFTDDFSRSFEEKSWKRISYKDGSVVNPRWVNEIAPCPIIMYASLPTGNGSAGQKNDWLISPLITLPAGSPLSLNFLEKKYNPGIGGSNYHIKISTTLNNPECFVDLAVYDEKSISSAFNLRSIDLTFYAGKSVYIAFVVDQQDGDGWRIDDISVDNTPVKTEVIWSGTNSTEWGLGSNWIGGTAPTSFNKVVIPGNCPHYPVLNQQVSVLDFAIKDGAKLVLNDGANLTVTGNFQLGTGGSGELQIQGGTCTISGYLFCELGSKFSITKGVLTTQNWTRSASEKLVVGNFSFLGGTITVNGGVLFSAENVKVVMNDPAVMNVVNRFSNSGSTWTMNGGTINMSGLNHCFGAAGISSSSPASSPIFYNLNISDAMDKFRLNLNSGTAKPFYVKNNLTINRADVRMDSVNILYIGGNLVNNAILSTNAKTSIHINGNIDNKMREGLKCDSLILTGNDQTMKGAFGINHIVKKNTSPSVLTFGSGEDNYVWTGTLDLQGTPEHLLSLRSDVEGHQWEIKVANAYTLNNLDVKDSKNTGNTNILACNLINSGNNSGWDLPTTKAGNIIGPKEVSGESGAVKYSVPVIDGATSYVWTLPVGVTGNSTSESILLTFSNQLTTADIKVKGHNTCGDGAESKLTIKVNQTIASFPFTDDFSRSFTEKNWKRISYKDGSVVNSRWINEIASPCPLIMYAGLPAGDGSAGQKNDWLISPLIPLPAGTPLSLNFLEKKYNPGIGGSSYHIKISTTLNSPESFEDLAVYDEKSINSAFYLRSIDLTSYAGKSVYIAFVVDQQDGDGWGIDDISVDNTPVKTEVVWSGTNSTEWGLGSNWIGGMAPASTNKVAIPGNCPHYPVINQQVSVLDFAIKDGAKLVLNDGANLTVTGNFQLGTGVSGELQIQGGTCNISAYLFCELGSKFLITKGTLTTQNWTRSASEKLVVGNFSFLGGSITVNGGVLFSDENVKVVMNDPAVMNVVNRFSNSESTWTMNGGTINMSGLNHCFGAAGISSSSQTSYPIFYNLNISGAMDKFHLNLNSGSVKPFYVKNNLIINNSDVRMASVKTLIVGGDLVNNSILWGPNTSIKVHGNFDNMTMSGLQCDSVILTGDNQTLNGQFAIGFLGKKVTKPSVLTFASDPNKLLRTLALDLQGSPGNILSLRSSIEGKQWQILISDHYSMQYLDVKDSKNIGTSTILGCNLVNSGNNTRWDLPATKAGNIDGQTAVCSQSGAISYSVPAIEGATSYLWTLPDGVTGSSTSNSILLTFSNQLTAADIKVKGHNNCGDGAESKLTVLVNQIPGVAGLISGKASVCSGTGEVKYSIEGVQGAKSYNWTLPKGTTGSSTSSAISVDFGSEAASGDIKVSAQNDCGIGADSKLFVNVLTVPENAGIIDGEQSICSGTNGLIFTVPEIKGADSYLWTVPTGATGTSTLSSITLDFPNSAISGNITVKGHNQCGNGLESSKSVVVKNNCTTGITDFLEGTVIKTYPNPTSDRFEILFKDPVTEETSIYLFDMSGAKLLSKVLHVQGNSISIDLSGYPIGSYLIQIKSKTNTWYSRIVKN